MEIHANPILIETTKRPLTVVCGGVLEASRCHQILCEGTHAAVYTISKISASIAVNFTLRIFPRFLPKGGRILPTL